MTHKRLTIARSMGLVGLAASGLAAVRHPSYLAANAAFSLAVGLFFAATVAGWASRNASRRLYWRASALAGWGYLALSLGPVLDASTGPHLITTTLIDLAYEHCYSTPYSWPELRDTPAFPANSDKWKLWDWPDHVINKRVSNAAFQIMTPEPFYRIGHSIFSLLAALAGGQLALMIARASATGDEPISPGPA